MSKLLWFGVAVLLGAAIAYQLIPEPAPVYRTVFVEDTVIIEREPDTVRTFVDRVVTKVVTPATVAVAETGGLDHALEFCKPITVMQQDTVTDTVYTPMLLLRSVRFDQGWFTKPDKVFMSGITNTGELRAYDYRTKGSWTARAFGDSLLVQTDRFATYKKLAEYLVVGGIAYGLGRGF